MAKVDIDKSGLKYGKVIGQFIANIPDSPRPELDEYPDGWALGGEIDFIPSIRHYSLNGKLFFPEKITAHLDKDGVLKYNDNESIYLISTQTPGMEPIGWTYKVVPRLKLGTKSVDMKNFHITVGIDQTINLATVSPVSLSTGESISRGVGIASVRVDTETQSVIFTLENGEDLSPVNIGSLAEVNFSLDQLHNYVNQAQQASTLSINAKNQIIPIYDDIKLFKTTLSESQKKVLDAESNVNSKVSTLNNTVAHVNDLVTQQSGYTQAAKDSADSAKDSENKSQLNKETTASYVTQAQGYQQTASTAAVDAQTAAQHAETAQTDVTTKYNDIKNKHSEVVDKAQAVADGVTTVTAAKQDVIVAKDQVNYDKITVNNAVSTVGSAASSANNSALAAEQSKITAVNAASNASTSASNANTDAQRAENAANKAQGAMNGGYIKPSTGIPTTDLEASIQQALTMALNSSQAGHTHAIADISNLQTTLTQKYVKPSTGIPETDLASDVKTKLAKGDTASQPGHTHTIANVTGLTEKLATYYSKPTTGIGTEDLSDDVKASLTKADSALQPGVTFNQNQINGLTDALSSKYQKPTDGISEVDMTQSVRNSLSKANSASQPGHTHSVSEVNFDANHAGIVTVTEDKEYPGLDLHKVKSPTDTNLSGNYYMLGDATAAKFKHGLTLPVGTQTHRVAQPLKLNNGKYMIISSSGAFIYESDTADDTSPATVANGVAKTLKAQEFVSALPALPSVDTVYFVYE